MRRRTRKKRGGMPQGPGPASSAEPEPPIEYVIKNTQANINSFKNNNNVRALLENDTDTTGFNAMIQQMLANLSDEGFWIVEWNKARDPDDTYNYFHLAWTHDDTEPPDLIRFVGSSGGRKKRKRKTRKKKRKKRRKKKTKRRRRKNKR